AIPPRLFTIGGKEIGEPRFEVSRDVRQDHGYRIRFPGTLLAEFIVSRLFESALSQVLVASPFAFNRLKDFSHDSRSGSGLQASGRDPVRAGGGTRLRSC